MGSFSDFELDVRRITLVPVVPVSPLKSLSFPLTPSHPSHPSRLARPSPPSRPPHSPSFPLATPLLPSHPSRPSHPSHSLSHPPSYHRVPLFSLLPLILSFIPTVLSRSLSSPPIPPHSLSLPLIPSHSLPSPSFPLIFSLAARPLSSSVRRVRPVLSDGTQHLRQDPWGRPSDHQHRTRREKRIFCCVLRKIPRTTAVRSIYNRKNGFTKYLKQNTRNLSHTARTLKK